MGSGLEKEITDVLPYDGLEVACYFFWFPENACLGISFLLDITVPTPIVLHPHKWSKITQPVNNTECHVVF